MIAMENEAIDRILSETGANLAEVIQKSSYSQPSSSSLAAAVKAPFVIQPSTAVRSSSSCVKPLSSAAATAATDQSRRAGEVSSYFNTVDSLLIKVDKASGKLQDVKT